MDKYDTSQLTEFPRFEPESNQSGVSTFFNKLWKFPIFSPNDTGENLQDKPTSDAKQDGSQSDGQSKRDGDDTKTETGSYAVELEGRSLANVLKRISSLVALGSGGGTRYADTELARYWMPDDISRECYECAARFSTLRRRHHCRVCGQIFCSRCCSQRVPGQIFGCADGLRVCNYCCNVVLSYLKENDMTGDISPDLRVLQENLQVKFPDNKSTSSANMGRDNFMFSRDQEERCEVRATPSETIQDVYRQLSFTLPTQQHRYRLVRYNGVWRGCDILQWVMDNTSNKTRVQATQVCQALVAGGHVECVADLPHFADYALYRPTAPPPPLALHHHQHHQHHQHRQPSPEDSSRLVESTSSYCLDLNLDNSSARLIKAPRTEVQSSPSSEEDNPVLEQSEGDTESSKLCKAIEESGEDHLRLLMRQCVAREGLAPSWADVLYPLCQRAAEIITLDMSSNDMDVRNYVQVKKVPGGEPRDSHLVHGVVLTKNVAHRGMPQEINNPTVLLLDCSIAYQRVEGKLTSLEPVLLQEQQYLVRCAARICALRPRVVLVRGAAARGVQDALRGAGVALAARVPERALRRLARAARADRVASVDARIAAPRLGTARRFRVRAYDSKTLMILEGCAEPHLGCCILLRGGSLQELIRVKKVTKFMLLACYNWKLEKAFLADIEATLPEPGMTFDDDADTNSNDKNDFTKSKNDKDEATAVNNDIFSTDDTQPNIDVNESSVNDLTDNDTEKSDVNKISSGNDSNSNENNDSNKKIVSDNDANSNDNDSNKSKFREFDDPLQRAKTYARKTDSEKTFSGVPIQDFSDPLHSTLSVDDDVFLPKEEAKLKADNHTDRWSTDDVVLSMSPNVVIPAPYLATEAGRRCGLRQYLRDALHAAAPAPRPATPRARRVPHAPQHAHAHAHAHARPPTLLTEPHPFIRDPITASADDPAVKAALANYRATGCRLVYNGHKTECPLYEPSVVKKASKELEVETKEKQNESEPLDPLAPENHQRISLLLYSYSNKSANVPDFCVNPWIVTMDMYGRHDISLGAFLQKYCFNPDYKCPSSNCQVPMNQHVRKFVHDDVCITITCNTIGHSNVDKTKEESNKQVSFWSRCGACGAARGARAMSRAALSLSLAAYVRARAAAPRYVRARLCAHPLHAHAHAFVAGLTTACFRYSKIEPYDIQLPPEVIYTNYDTKQMRDALIQQLNDLMLKGHETFSCLTDSEAEKEYQSFKQHTDQIHLALTSAQLQEHTSPAAVVHSLWAASDRLVCGEKMLRDAQDKWAAALAKSAKAHSDNAPVEDKSDLEDSISEGGTESSGTTYTFTDNNTKEAEKDHAGTEEDEEKGDKKTVKQILSQLLSSNQPSQQGGMIISSGLVPVVVQAGDIGSVIAATLASRAYLRAAATATATSTAATTAANSTAAAAAPSRHSTQAELDDADNKDNNSAAGKEKTDGDKNKQAKSNDHFEVLLKDGLLCRVYYAPQFHKLRHMLLAPLSANPHIADEFARRGQPPPAGGRCSCEDGRDKADNRSVCEVEEGFVRSLARCVPWAARGGKSGSTFCKTHDDRYVLKEMTKPEWQQFLEFAPHYFNYVTNCHQNKLPSLLARILGVYSVGGAGGVLVMENVWYGCGPDTKRFDLKGSSRHRLAADTQPLSVLMDENLLNLRWQRQLFVQSAAARVVWAGVERDCGFLAARAVMDYSLLLGLQPRTLVLGVIDYIRTFTWDKKLEHLVKKNLGAGQPTVVSPEEYKQRFCAALRKYFLQCPAHWDHIYNTT
ncbi:1-phosphatidylinositol 3-phosphate 5-kinase [Galleria mellonella]|uniref:1-phosphatidylinositol-3-phosphate 5-kinase n=1 Tax=Galleria mellonella TaxID=7137 RepID=A0ABM3N5T4_GALME|nr:1-phosphatidylinositol 3-phosphate 5-kinase [Galleria mellonella]